MMNRRRFLASLLVVSLFIGGCAAPPVTTGAWVVNAAGRTFNVRVGQPQPPLPVDIQTGQQVAVPQNDREQWALAFLHGIGNTAPDYNTMQFVVAWQGGENTAATFNPLATTQTADGATCFNYINGKCGVKNFVSYDQGLQANIETITNGYYPNILAGLRTNSPEQALNADEFATWGTGLGNVESGYRKLVQTAPVQQTFAPVAFQDTAMSAPISFDGDCGWNVQVALDANSSALRNVMIQPGETFSFNATMGNPDAIAYRTCAGVPGGNWCNLAARYAQAARLVGVANNDIQFLHHNVDLGAGIENDILIWNIGGEPGFEGGRQDLLITNTTGRSLRFQAQQTESNVAIAAQQGA